MVIFLREKFSSVIGVAVILCILVGVFLTIRLGRWDAFVYRPGSYTSDFTITFWPNIYYIQQSFQKFGELPLWRTLIFSGHPFDVDPQSGLWYLPNLLFLLFPAGIEVFNTLLLLHLVVGGLGMWVWSREVGTSALGSLISSLAYTFTPKIYAHLGFGHIGLVYAAAYIPWVMWSGYMVGKGRWFYSALFALFLGFQIIANPQLALYTGLVACVYVFALALWISKRSNEVMHFLRMIGSLAFGILLAISISAIQVIPMLRFAPYSSRSEIGFSDTAISSIPFRYLWGLVLGDHNGFMDYILYMGIPVLILALLALYRRQAWYWWTFLVFSVIYSLGDSTPIYAIAYKILPFLAWLRAPSRIIFLSSAAFALMSGWGFDRLVKGYQGWNRKILNLTTFAFGTFALSLVGGYWIVIGPPPLNWLAFGFVIPTTAIIFIILGSGKLPTFTAFTVVALLVLVDLWIVDFTLIEGRPVEDVIEDHGLGEYLNQEVGGEPFRVYSPSYSLPRQVAALWGIESVDGVDPLYLREYDLFMQLASGVERKKYGVTIPAMEEGESMFLVNRDAVPRLDLLGLLNVKYVASNFPLVISGLHEVNRFGSIYLYENDYFLPRVFIVGNIDVVDDFKSALEWLDDHDVSQEVVVENGIQMKSGDIKSDITWLLRSPNQMVLRVKNNRPGYLVLSQPFYPGWQVSVDGKKGTLYQVDGILVGLPIDTGTHLVEFHYRPYYFNWGIGISLFGILIGVILLLYGLQYQNKY